MTRTEPTISDVRAAVYTFPTPEPEADGTLRWQATTAVVVEVGGGGQTGLGWTYSTGAAAQLIREHLVGAVTGRAVEAIPECFERMHRACRNLGGKGLVMQAISAVDIALWDLAARLRNVPVTALLGRARDRVAVYGSGGFTTLTDEQLHEQVTGWAAAGCGLMKIKIAESWGSCVVRDLERVRLLRAYAGDDVRLMVDANGGYTRGQARRVGAVLDELGVVWFEEPVSSDDVQGLAILRDALRCDVTAGEYASDGYDARALCGAVDCLQLDATRCGGYTGFVRGAAIAAAHNLEVSGHCAPALHAPVAAAVPNLRHIEWFADHARLEPLLVDGVPEVRDGALVVAPDLGHGLRLRPEARQYRTDT